MIQSIDEHYQHLCQNGTLVHNAFQQEAVFLLEDVMERLMRWVQYPRWIQRLFLRQGPKGIYMYGDVGRGKTMLMDLFFDAVPFHQKKRMHFHTFMKEVHDALKEDTTPKGLENLAHQWRQQVSVLCLDNMMVDHIADAMVIRPLFEAFMHQGILLIITSSTAPEDLYAKGLRRDQFMSFTEDLQKNLHIFHLQSDHNHRRHLKLPRYFHDVIQLHKAYFHLTQADTLKAKALNIHGHSIACVANQGRTAIFSFQELCEEDRTKEEYLELVLHFDNFFLENIPILTPSTNSTKRFMLLIEILYDAGCGLYLNASAPIEKLYGHTKEIKAIQQTISRIREMTNIHSNKD